MSFAFLKKPWLPMLVGFILAGSFVFLQPGLIVKDAGEYDALSRSILQGEYAIDGEASMLREPGYPVFRAVIYLITNNPSVILWAQVLLFVAIIWLVWDSLRRLDPSLAVLGAWSAALSYGLAVYASRHLLEIFAAFLVSLIVWFAVRAMNSEKLWGDLIGFSLASGVLVLTRVPLALVPIALGMMLAWHWKKKGFIEVVKRGSVFAVILVVLVSPWVIRNGKTFGVWSITGRTGIQVAARAYKANESCGRLQDSLGSVVIGRSLNTLTYPTSKPIILEQWKWVWDRFAAWGIDRNEIDADKALRKEAFGILLSDIPHFLRGGLWSFVDMGRLLALPSPLSPEFGIEGMFWPKVEAGTIGVVDRWILTIAHFVQIIWWIGMLAGLYFGFQRFGVRFFPGLVAVSVVIAHIPADNIVRYAAPMQPWLLFLAGAGLGYVVLPRLTRGKYGLKLGPNRYGTRT
jgi:4-amino-4-deoxy-L-arabinose transferase-like glycosyltransferase